MMNFHNQSRVYSSSSVDSSISAYWVFIYSYWSFPFSFSKLKVIFYWTLLHIYLLFFFLSLLMPIIVHALWFFLNSLHQYIPTPILPSPSITFNSPALSLTTIATWLYLLPRMNHCNFAYLSICLRNTKSPVFNTLYKLRLPFTLMFLSFCFDLVADRSRLSPS